MSAGAPEATGNDSRGEPTPRARRGGRERRHLPIPGFAVLRGILAVVGVLGVVFLVLATTSTLIKIDVLTVTKETQSGADRHSLALVLIGAFALVMLLGALRGARPAMAAVAACGIAVLAIAIVGDAPDIHDTGQVGELYEDATAEAGNGFYYETLGGALLLIAGGGLLMLAGAGAGTSRTPEREDPERSEDDWFSATSE